ncbi:MAG: dihydropteroate synthase [Kiritimatiellae bacterium]|nr:dihydropteroate synthase [Kiritimatiellia bacterium]
MGARQPQRLTRWLCRDRSVEFRVTPLIMGILNLTPDSFSDGGRFNAPDAAIARALQMQRDGADIIDIGGESTRPGANPVPAHLECERILPVIEALSAESDVLISVDTTKADVAGRALAAGAHIVNDVSATTGDADMTALVVESGAGVVLMHMQGTPGSMQDKPKYDDVVNDVRRYLLERAEILVAAGVVAEQIVVDPGIGFGKTLEHNLSLLNGLTRLSQATYPLLVGLSRKRWIGELTGREAQDRLAGSLVGAMVCAQRGAKIVRVHDVAETRDAFSVVEALSKGV